MKQVIILFLYITATPAINGQGIHTFYPPVPEAVKSEAYAVQVNNTNVFVEKMSRFDVPFHYARFAYAGGRQSTITITTAQTISSFTISPKSRHIQGNAKGNKLVFTINEPQYLVITINAMEYLFLLIDAPEVNPPRPGKAGIKNIMDYGIDTTGKISVTKKIQQAIDEAAATGQKSTLYFPAGVYLTGQLNMKSNVSLYLEAGALIKGSIDLQDYKSCLIRFDSVSNAAITGRGTIDGSGWMGLRKNGGKELYLLFLSDCKNILIDGLVLRDPCFWNTRVFKSVNIRLRNIKILNNRPAVNWSNTDGVDFDSSRDCYLSNSLMHTGDDNMVVKGLDDRREYNTERIVFEKIIGISNSAAAKIGTETTVKYFRNITFRDIDIITCKRAIVINGFDSSNIQHITFNGLNIEAIDYNGREKPRIIDIEITDHSWRPCTGRCSITGVSISNVSIHFSPDSVQSQIYGRTLEYGVRNILIQNYKVKGVPIASLKEGNIVTNEFVSGIVVRK